MFSGKRHGFGYAVFMVGSKSENCTRDMGYTKVSFASKAGISRLTFDKLLNGSIDSKSSFDRHLQKILKLLDMTVEDLMLYHTAPAKPVRATVFSQNAPMGHEMSELITAGNLELVIKKNREIKEFRLLSFRQIRS